MPRNILILRFCEAKGKCVPLHPQFLHKCIQITNKDCYEIYTHGGSFFFLGNALYCKKGISVTPWFYTEQGISSKLTLIAGCSHAFTADAECKDFVGCGALYQFRKCQLGAFTDYANFMERKEFATELTCKIPVFQYLDIQPTVHLITYNGSLQCVATLRMALFL